MHPKAESVLYMLLETEIPDVPLACYEPGVTRKNLE